MRYFLILVMSILFAQAANATTYSTQAVGTADAERWGLNIVASRTNTFDSTVTFGLNAANFARCRITFATILVRDGNGKLVRTIRPFKFGRGYYVNLDEEVIGSSSIELKCEPKRNGQPGEQYTLELSGYVKAI